MIYFKEINIDSTANGSENMAKPNPSPPQEADVQYQPIERPAVESGQEPETSYSSSRPETQESVRAPPLYDVTKQELSPVQEEPSSSQEVFNERPNYKEDGETNKKPSPPGSRESATYSAPSYEGSDHMQSRPFYPESEAAAMKARTAETKTRPGPEESSEAKDEKDATLEKITQLPEHDEVPKKLQEPPKKLREPTKKLHEPPAGLTYVAPLVSKPPSKKPAPVPMKLPPELALITPKRGIHLVMV